MAAYGEEEEHTIAAGAFTSLFRILKNLGPFSLKVPGEKLSPNLKLSLEKVPRKKGGGGSRLVAHDRSLDFISTSFLLCFDGSKMKEKKRS